jgi:hypothetical protein
VGRGTRGTARGREAHCAWKICQSDVASDPSVFEAAFQAAQAQELSGRYCRVHGSNRCILPRSRIRQGQRFLPPNVDWQCTVAHGCQQLRMRLPSPCLAAAYFMLWIQACHSRPVTLCTRALILPPSLQPSLQPSRRPDSVWQWPAFTSAPAATSWRKSTARTS